MMPHALWLSALLCAALLTGLPRPAQAQAAGEQDASGLRLLEASAGAHRLSAGLPDWREAQLRGVYQQGDHFWSGELLLAERFGEGGTYVALQDRIRVAPRWDLALGYGLGDGATWLPRDRVDGFAHHTWGAHGNLVSHFGLGYYRAPSTNYDRWGSLGLSAYLQPWLGGPWVLQGEVRWTRSNPGAVDTRQQMLALSWGHAGQTVVTLRHGWGREGWQSLGDAVFITNFASRQNTLTLRHWLGPDWGLRLVADDYRNDQYQRQGLTLGFFRQWP